MESVNVSGASWFFFFSFFSRRTYIIYLSLDLKLKVVSFPFTAVSAAASRTRPSPSQSLPPCCTLPLPGPPRRGSSSSASAWRKTSRLPARFPARFSLGRARLPARCSLGRVLPATLWARFVPHLPFLEGVGDQGPFLVDDSPARLPVQVAVEGGPGDPGDVALAGLDVLHGRDVKGGGVHRRIFAMRASGGLHFCSSGLHGLVGAQGQMIRSLRGNVNTQTMRKHVGWRNVL